MRRVPNRCEIDRDKVRVQARMLDRAGLLVWLDRAIDLHPDEALSDLIAGFVDLQDVLADENTTNSLLCTIREFHRDSMSGHSYEAFRVDSRNFMQMSRGTEVFIAEHSRLVDACLRAEQAGDLATAAEGLGLLIELMREIDRGERDIVFFADEAGSWQVGVPWERVLPAWFRSLAPTSEPHEWARTVVDAVNDFAGYKMHDMLAAAREIATPEQRKALAEHEDDLR